MYLIGYTLREVRQTVVYAAWFAGLYDTQSRVRVLARVRRLSCGNPGDHAGVGDGVMELRIHTGPGYRVYFVVRDSEVVILLAGGDKSSQRRDVRRAKKLTKGLDER